MLFASNCCHFEVKYTTIHWSIHCIQLRGVREQKQFPEPSRPQQSTSPHFSIVLHSLAITPLIHYTATGYRVQAITPLLHCHRVLANWKFSIFQTNHPSISIFYSLSILLCLLLIDLFQAEVLCQVKVPSPSQTKLRKSEYLFQGRAQYQTLSLKHKVQWSAVNKEKVQPSSLKTQKKGSPKSHKLCQVEKERDKMPVERRGVRALQIWCQRVTSDYPSVTITDMSTSWRVRMRIMILILSYCDLDYDVISVGVL